MNAMEISLSGLDVEWRRMEIVALNLANINTTRSTAGGAYVPLRLVSGPAENFRDALDRGEKRGSDRPKGVRVYAIEQMKGQMRRVYEPEHPGADAKGFVAYPDVSQASEMSLLMKSARSYEANLVAMAAAQQIYSSALQIGRQS